MEHSLCKWLNSKELDKIALANNKGHHIIKITIYEDDEKKDEFTMDIINGKRKQYCNYYKEGLNTSEYVMSSNTKRAYTNAVPFMSLRMHKTSCIVDI